MHMDDKAQIEEISEKFNRYTHHGYTISRTEAKESGLPVVYPDRELQDLMWRLWLSIGNDMDASEHLHPMNSLKKDKGLMAKLDKSIENNKPFRCRLEESTHIAMIESRTLSCHYDIESNILVEKNDLNMSFNVTANPTGWKRDFPIDG